MGKEKSSGVENGPILFSCFRKVVLQTEKSLLQSYYGYNGGFYGCLIEPQAVLAWWKETAQICVFVLSCSLLLDHLEPQSSKTKLLLLIMSIDTVAYAVTLLRDNLCRNSCILQSEVHHRELRCLDLLQK